MLPVAVAQSSVGGVLNTLCTSGFVDDVIFSYDGFHGGVILPKQLCCNAVCSRAGFEKFLLGLVECRGLGTELRCPSVGSRTKPQ